MSPATERWFRPDIEGLRAIALLAVLAFHAAIPGLAGGFVGVDVFFVISGYLITSLLLREALTTGRIRLTSFFARRARRLLPSAAVVLIAVVPAAMLLLPPLTRPDLYRDLLAAALSLANWRYIDGQTDYLAAGRDQSALLHFWSLAVEEQFYVVWAPLFALVLLLVVRRGAARNPARYTRGALFVLAAAATGLSLWLCLHWSGQSVSLAYLGTPSRAWQFGAGALVALLPERQRIPAPLRTLLGWAGAAAILVAAVRYTAATPYPGTAALLPTAGAAAVILAGTGPGADRSGVGRLLALRGPRAVGRLSYQLYLWHWPVLVLTEARTGPLPWPAKTALTAAALLPALAARRWVETPLRASSTVSELPRRGLSLGLSAMVIPVVLGLVAGSTALGRVGPTEPVDLKALPQGAATGPGLLADGSRAAKGGALTPEPAQARGDFPPDGDCLVPPAATTSPPCRFGGGPGKPRIVLLGDSHAGQWHSALRRIAERRGWRLEELAKQGCPLARVDVVNPQLGHRYRECDTWRDHALGRLRSGPRPALIVLASLNRYTDDRAELRRGWDDTLRRLRATGAPLAYLKDTPTPGMDVPACVSGRPDDPGGCSFPRGTALTRDPLAEDIAAGRRAGVRLVDVNPVLCPGDPEAGAECPAVRQGILLYRDSAHLTNVAALLLAPRVERRLVRSGALPAAEAGRRYPVP